MKLPVFVPISDVAIGTDFDHEVIVPNLPSGHLLASASWSLRERSPDAPRLVHKVVTPATSVDGAVTDMGADGTGAVLFQILAADTTLLAAGRAYDVDVWVTLDDGRADQVEVGILTTRRAVGP